MSSGTGLDILQEVSPDKVIDMGITESSVVTSSRCFFWRYFAYC